MYPVLGNKSFFLLLKSESVYSDVQTKYFQLTAVTYVVREIILKKTLLLS
jgi:hypothetical protein